jgi:uncharacterized protein YkwD
MSLRAIRETLARTARYAALMVALALGAASAARADLPSVSGSALALVNGERAASGRPPLVGDPALDRAALAHARDMLARGYFAHVSPEGLTPAHRVARAGARWRALGENIAWCRRCRADAAQLRRFQAQWMASRGHRRNILAQGPRAFGFALVAEGDVVFAVQVFGGGN